jgi:hypothetical protein
MKPELLITNRSRYDDIAIHILVNFAFDTVHKDWPITTAYRLKIKVTNTVNSWGGYAYVNGTSCDSEGFHVCVRIGAPSRFKVPRRISYDHKWKDMPEMFLNDWRECVVYIAAHEFGHTAGRSGRKNGEIGTEFAGQDAVDLYRKQRAEIDGRIEDRIRTRDTRTSATEQRRESRAAFAKSAAGRLQKSEKMLAYWERRAKIAHNKIKRYRRSVGALRKSVLREEAGKLVNLPQPLEKAAITTAQP